VKKDIWATITFLTTLVLFYLAQVEGVPQKVLSSADECGVAGAGVVEGRATGTGGELSFIKPMTLDS